MMTTSGVVAAHRNGQHFAMGNTSAVTKFVCRWSDESRGYEAIEELALAHKGGAPDNFARVVAEVVAL
jgi:hypothetical protein